MTIYYEKRNFKHWDKCIVRDKWVFEWLECMILDVTNERWNTYPEDWDSLKLMKDKYLVKLSSWYTIKALCLNKLPL